MNIWIINPFDNLPLEGFRPQRYWLMSQAFAAAGHDVTLFTTDFNHTTKKRRVVVRDTDFVVRDTEHDEPRATNHEPRATSHEPRFPHEPRLVLIPTKPYSSNVSFARIRSHRAFIKNLRSALHLHLDSPPSLIIVSLPLIGTADVALELKRKCGAKVVVDIMDDWPGTFYRLFPRIVRPFAKLALSPLRRAAERAYREADLVTGVADRYAELALSAGAKRYCRFYHGILLNPGSGEDAASPVEVSRDQLGMRSPDRSDKRLLYLGNLGRTYDLRTAIEAVALDPQLTLDIAGKGEQEESLKAFAAEKGVTDRVRFHGYLGEAALAELAATCAFGLIPMSDDSCVGVPYKLADYARFGLFILSSLRGESAALLEKHHVGALYTAGDPQSLVEKLKSRVEVEDRSSKSSVSPVPSPQSPDFPSLLSDLDAAKIYREYVNEVLK